jgi:phosphatidylglycerol:prolipoprotein diacylglycerol transferase
MVLVNGELQSRFPSQLLEATLEGFFLFFILLYTIKKNKNHKQITITFLFFYSFFRIISEFVREPDIHIGYIYKFWTLGMIFSFITLTLSIILVLIKEEKHY